MDTSDASDTPDSPPRQPAHEPSLGSSGSVGRDLDIGSLVQSLLDSGDNDIYRKVCAAVDRFIIERVLRHVDGHQVEASQRLGISRTTLRAKMRHVGLAVRKELRLPAKQPDQ
jgi:two-component system nitrogen regulation response regulator GlnG